MALTPREKISVAILRAIEPPKGIAPYFGAIMRGLVRREMSPETEAMMEAMGMKPTLFVTGDGVLQWSAKFIDTIDVVEVAWSLIHEVMHIVLDHPKRAIAKGIPPRLGTHEDVSNSRLWNLAGDACINEDLAKMNGAALPGWWVMPATLEQKPGLTTEERYELLRRKREEILKQLKKEGVGAGGCGTCSGHPVPGEPPGKNEDGRSEAEMERFRKQTAEDVKEACGKSRGTVPASLERWANEYLKPPKIDWRTKLARLVRGAVSYQAGKADFTFTKMSRRQGGLGYGVGRAVVPALHAPKPNAAVVIDTSGSMSETDLSDALIEVRGVLAAVGAGVTVCVCDAEVHGIKRVENIEQAAKMLKGGGGTAMEPALAAVAELKDKPSVCIVLTDGYIDNPPEPSFSVIWAIIGGNKDFSPSYGQTVFVERDEKA
ncbi:MAG TPA: VWA-like domain-containing protein [Vicinamibacterales bacterium]|jgi:predicted metal-dependent peptidase|nr:VWA-like domain-containing protein [Vicinamibacterales bacterium]